MAKPFVISDPVHRYLRVAAHERIVIDNPITQRLRRITQTGLVEFIYPEARTSRFIHSLGAMHLASRFVISALENASREDVTQFFNEIKKNVSKYACTPDDLDDFLTEDNDKSTGGLSTLGAVFKDKTLQQDKDIRGWLGIVEAAIRLAALFHDLGHLPFSHDFEYALKEHVRERKNANVPLRSELIKLASCTPHELVGHKLADLVFRGLINDGEKKPAVRIAYSLAMQILDAEPDYSSSEKPRVTALQWLHTLIDGDIDVDRADYLLRDGRAIGLGFAGFNLDQLVHNLILVLDKDALGFVTAVDERGFNALESYCLVRARNNQMIIRHHKSAQLGAAFRYASVEALKSEQATPFLNELSDIVAGTTDATRAKELLRGFAIHDDPWWIGVLRQIKPDTNLLLRASLDLVLERKQTLWSIWKRKGELSEVQRKTINRFNKMQEYTQSSSMPESETLQESAIQIKQLREDFNVLLVFHKFKPYSTLIDRKRSQMMVKTGKKLTPVSKLSPLIRSLRDTWEEDVHIHAFTLKETSMTVEEVIKRMTTVHPSQKSVHQTSHNSSTVKSEKKSDKKRLSKPK